MCQVYKLVIPGRHLQVANPESITLGRWSWIPGSRKSATRNDAAKVCVNTARRSELPTGGADLRG
jgi:hypothetical protein